MPFRKIPKMRNARIDLWRPRHEFLFLCLGYATPKASARAVSEETVQVREKNSARSLRPLRLCGDSFATNAQRREYAEVTAEEKRKLTLTKRVPIIEITMPQKGSPTGEKPAERVFLIDSMSHIFRAFYAPMANRAAPLQTSKGQVTQAVFIFTNMLRKLLSDEKPKYITAVFESGEKTFRHETFSDYKANRQQMPDDLASQLPYIKRLCEAYNVPMISRPGFEADDVIGALAVQAADKD